MGRGRNFNPSALTAGSCINLSFACKRSSVAQPRCLCPNTNAILLADLCRNRRRYRIGKGAALDRKRRCLCSALSKRKLFEGFYVG